ncbi:MAG: hypothetical protein AAB779_03445 [Patescibacteria group bacterium]
MGTKFTSGARPDLHGHAERVKARVEQYKQPGATAGWTQKSHATNGRVKVDLSQYGVTGLRQRVHDVTDPKSFWENEVEHLAKPLVVKVATGLGDIKCLAVGIHQNGTGGSVAIDAKPFDPQNGDLPLIINRHALALPLSWHNLVRATKVIKLPVPKNAVAV